MAVVVDLPRGSTLEDIERTLFSIADVARQLPEVGSIETYEELPRHSISMAWFVTIIFARRLSWASLHLNLAARGERKRTSHAIALDLRSRLGSLTLPAGTVARVVEVPPGPPVLATLLAKVYGPDSATRRAVAPS